MKKASRIVAEHFFSKLGLALLVFLVREVPIHAASAPCQPVTGGSATSFYSPVLGRNDNLLPLGPIIGVYGAD